MRLYTCRCSIGMLVHEAFLLFLLFISSLYNGLYGHWAGGEGRSFLKKKLRMSESNIRGIPNRTQGNGGGGGGSHQGNIGRTGEGQTLPPKRGRVMQTIVSDFSRDLTSPFVRKPSSS